MKEFEIQAVDVLSALIQQVPAITVEDIQFEAGYSDRRIDIVARLSVANRTHFLVCEVKANGQPRYVRMALFQLRDYVAHFQNEATPVLIAPYLSTEAQALCRDSKVGYLDFQGNAWLVFDGIFIERIAAGKPSVERRELRSLFKPKSAQVLRVMLRDPQRAWRVAELANAAEVSLGHVSNVRTGLLDREWAKLSPQGLFLSDPNALLDEWRDEYGPFYSKRLGFYTTLHGGAFEEAARKVLDVQARKGKAIFASFSAAHWLAPYGRTGTQYFYADLIGLERLKEQLKLSQSSRGENVVITVPKEEGPFLDTDEPAPRAICTSAVQTYLDLWANGERGREAAEHLRRIKLSWWK